MISPLNKKMISWDHSHQRMDEHMGYTQSDDLPSELNPFFFSVRGFPGFPSAMFDYSMGCYNMLYPLVNIKNLLENGHRNSEFSHEKWCFSIAMLVRQRVYSICRIFFNTIH